MTDTILPGPNLQRGQEHVVAEPDRPRGLLQAIPDESSILGRLRGRHVLSASHFDAPLLRQLLRLAARYELGEIEGNPPLRCKVLSNLFLDHSQCILFSADTTAEAAAALLGIAVAVAVVAVPIAMRLRNRRR